MTRHIGHTVAAVILLLLCASFALGAPSVSIDSSGSGNGVYIIQVSNMDGVSGFDLALNYDNTVLASPSVSQGSLVSGAMFAANPNYSKNSIKIAVVSTKSFSGSGPVATITFATHTGTGSGVTVANFNPINDNGATVSGSTTGDASTGSTTTGSTTTGSTTTGSTTTGGTPTTTTGSSNPTYLGTVTMPSDSQSQYGTKPAPEAGAKSAEAPATAETSATTATTATPAVNETAAVAKTKKAEAAISTVSNTAVLERFRAYQGVKTPAILIALFKQQISASFRQEPFVALSDGTTTVTIVADLSADSGSSPNVALNGAKLVSLRQDDASSAWFIEALPTKDALSASLMVLSENRVTEYPLTIAPAIKNAASTEAAFAAFLKDAAQTPAQHDLNGDGNYDGSDDYIYTANYLVRQQKAKATAQ